VCDGQPGRNLQIGIDSHDHDAVAHGPMAIVVTARALSGHAMLAHQLRLSVTVPYLKANEQFATLVVLDPDMNFTNMPLARLATVEERMLSQLVAASCFERKIQQPA
jgi:hypothetical protein